MDTVTFSGRSVPNMPIGGAERMSGFDTGFDGYLGLGPNIQFNKTGKLYAGNGSMFSFFSLYHHLIPNNSHISILSCRLATSSRLDNST
jgi:hypothetical protein